VVSRERTKGNVHKLKYRKHHLNIRKHLCTVRVVETSGHRLPLEVVESSTLVIFKTQLDAIPSR